MSENKPLQNPNNTAHPATKAGESLPGVAKELGIEVVYRCQATWLEGRSVLVEATRDTARLKKGEFLILNLP